MDTVIYVQIRTSGRFLWFILYDTDSLRDADRRDVELPSVFQPQHKDHVMDRPSLPGQASETPGGV